MTRLSIESDQCVDALVAGTVFLDVVLGGLPRAPRGGEEIWANSRALCPGGIANNAIALARLGMSTALVAAIGTDAVGQLVWDSLLQQSGLDLSRVLRTPAVETALTVSLAAGTDRGLVSHGALDPVPVERISQTLPRARTCFVSLKPEPARWVRLQHAAGAVVFAGVGFDDRHGWSSGVLDQLDDVDVLVLNDLEALAYARSDSVEEAARRLGASVPLVVITRGAHGAYALDSASSTEVSVGALPVEPLDTTGAGDVFVSALMRAWLLPGALQDRMRFASLCAGLSVTRLGGASGAPSFAEVRKWLEAHPQARRDARFLEERAFLRDPAEHAADAEIGAP